MSFRVTFTAKNSERKQGDFKSYFVCKDEY